MTIDITFKRDINNKTINNDAYDLNTMTFIKNNKLISIIECHTYGFSEREAKQA